MEIMEISRMKVIQAWVICRYNASKVIDKGNRRMTKGDACDRFAT